MPVQEEHADRAAALSLRSSVALAASCAMTVRTFFCTHHKNDERQMLSALPSRVAMDANLQ